MIKIPKAIYNATYLKYFAVSVDQLFFSFLVVAGGTFLPQYFLVVASVTAANNDNSFSVIVAFFAVVATLTLKDRNTYMNGTYMYAVETI